MSTILELCADRPVRALQPGEVLLDEGVTSGCLFVLIDGAVEILKQGIQINVVSDAGAIFGEISLLLGIPHMASVRAVKPSRAHVIPDGAAFLQAHPQLAYHLAQLLAERLHGVTGYLVDLKRQFDDRDDHLALVDDVLETLVHQQHQTFQPGSDRDPG